MGVTYGGSPDGGGRAGHRDSRAGESRLGIKSDRAWPAIARNTARRYMRGTVAGLQVLPAHSI